MKVFVLLLAEGVIEVYVQWMHSSKPKRPRCAAHGVSEYLVGRRCNALEQTVLVVESLCGMAIRDSELLVILVSTGNLTIVLIGEARGVVFVLLLAILLLFRVATRF